MMDIEFEKDELLFQEMEAAFNEIPDAFFKDHYQLSELTTYSALSWRKFLSHPKVVDWMKEEMFLVQQSRLRGLMQNLDSNSRSTGLPQLMNTLFAQTDKAKKDSTGPIFVYMYVPLNEQEMHAPNVQIAKDDSLTDIFRK